MDNGSTPGQVAFSSLIAIATGGVLWLVIRYVVGPVTPGGHARYLRQLSSPLGKIFQWGLPAVFVAGGVAGLGVALFALLDGLKVLGA